MPVWVSDPTEIRKGRIFGCALFLCLQGGAAAADDDIFAGLTGSFGDPFEYSRSCIVAPHVVSFSDDNGRAHFVLSAPALDYLGKMRSQGDYTVLSHASDRIVMALDDEQRLTDAGVPVVWVMRPSVGIDGYCWGRTDWPENRCTHLQVRCAFDTPTG